MTNKVLATNCKNKSDSKHKGSNKIAVSSIKNLSKLKRDQASMSRLMQSGTSLVDSLGAESK